MKEMKNEEERLRQRTRRIWIARSKRELRLKPGFQTHEHLLTIVKMLASDFEPYGNRKRTDQINPDCSGNCRWFHKLAGSRGADWGVCANPESPRSGLLTFEHMGCFQYEWDEREDYVQTSSGRRVLKSFLQAEKEFQAWQNARKLASRGLSLPK